MSAITTVAFDADDTLWHCERYFEDAQARFAALLEDHVDADTLAQRLLAAERRNLERYGYGTKGFILTMVETAMDITCDRVPPSTIRGILSMGHEMLSHPVDLMPHAAESIVALHGQYRLLLITKGDLVDQERKLAASGLRQWFDGIEIVSEKTPDVYAEAFAGSPGRGVMVGNSLKSDVLPMIAAGGHGVHVPAGSIWALDHAEPPVGESRFHEIAHLGALPDLLRRIGHEPTPR